MLALLLSLAPPIDDSSGFGHDVVRLSDLDGDGHAELAVLDRRTPPQAWVSEPAQAVEHVWILSGRTFEAFRRFEIPRASGEGSAFVACVEDWNGDGIDDVVALGSLERQFVVRVWDGRTGEVLRELVRDARGLSGAIARPGDVDGDCVPDLALGEVRFETYVGSEPPSSNGVRFVSGATGRTIDTRGELGNWRAFPDLDEDGQADLVVFGATAAGRASPSLSGSVVAWTESGARARADLSASAVGRRVVQLRGIESADMRLAVGIPPASIGAGEVEILALPEGALAGRVVVDDAEDLWHVGSALAVLDDADADGVEDLAIATDQSLSHLPGAVVIASGRSGRVLALIRRDGQRLVVHR